MPKTSDQNRNFQDAFRNVREAEMRRADDLIRLFEGMFTAIVEDVRTTIRAEFMEMPAASDRLLLKKEIAERLQVSVSTISKLQTQGLPCIPFGKSVRFDYSEVVAWAKENRNKLRADSKLRVVA